MIGAIMKLADVSVATVNGTWRALSPEVEGAADFETAAQALASELHTRFDDSVVLARVFLTVRFEDLPGAKPEFFFAPSRSPSAARSGVPPSSNAV